MDIDFWKTVLGSSAVVGFVTTLIVGALKIREQRFQARREDNRYEVAWAADYRAAAERHLPWDQQMRSRSLQHESLINELREKLGMEEIEFPPIPDAPPLFPARTKD